MSKRIIIAGGGTGGHIFPAIAIAHALKEADPSLEILFVGARGKMEMEKVPQAGFQIVGIDIAGYNRSSLIKNIGLPLKLLKSFLQVRKIIRDFRPSAVIGVGGYSSFPVLRVAQAKGIPSFIHESNSFAGKSNRLLGKQATRVFVAMEGMEKFFPAEKIIVTGNPVRSVIADNAVTREEGIRFFGLDPARKSILVTGGSLGARGINEAIEAGIGSITAAGLQLIWQTGKLFAERASEACAGNPLVWTGDFITRMECAYAAADAVVSRSGAMAIAEICVARKPAIFVPYPHAAEDHQTVNAQKLVEKNAGLLVADREAKEKLSVFIIDLLGNEEKMRQMSENIGRLAAEDADRRIAREVLTILGSS